MQPISENSPSALSTGKESPGESGQIVDLLQSVGLRPTRQRLAIAALLFCGSLRHASAEDLYEEAHKEGIPLSLATAYNALNQFAEAGLLRRILVGGARTYFDTDLGDHRHFYIEEEERVIDIEPSSIHLDGLPMAPPGYRIANIDVVIRLRRINSSGKVCSACAD